MSLLQQWTENESALPLGGPERGESPVPANGVRSALETAQDLDARKAEYCRKLARSLGLPEDLVLENPYRVAAEHKAREIERQPLLEKWAEEARQNAAIARDDTAGLSGVFDWLASAAEIKETSERLLDRGRALAGDEGAQLRSMRADGLSEDVINYGAFSQTPNPSPLEQIPLLLREGMGQVGKSLAGAVIALAENLQTTAEDTSLGLPAWDQREKTRNVFLRALANQARKSVEDHEQATSAPLQAEGVGGYAQDVVRQFPQLVAQAAVTLGTGGAGGMAFMGSQIAGGQYLDLTEQGVAPARAFQASLLNAGLQAPLEQLGLSKKFGIFKASGLGKVLKAMGEDMGTEFLTEWLQAYPEAATNIWAEAEVKGRTPEESLQYFFDHLGDITREGLYQGAVAAPFGLLGGLGRIATDARTAREAREFVQRQIELHNRVEATQTKAVAPSYLAEALEAGGLTQHVQVPASDVLRLQQSGMELAEPMGWDMQNVAEAAALGQDLEVPLSALHANLDTAQFQAVADIMRAVPQAMNNVEAAETEARLLEDTAALNAVFEEYQAEQNAVDAESERLRDEIASALKSVPNLKAQIESDATLEEAAEGRTMTPEQAANYYTDVLLRWAERRQEHTGMPVAESLRKFQAQGLVRDERGRLLTPDEMQEREEARAKAEAEAPFWDAVWGRLDGQSLKRDYPDAYRELSRQHGPGLFAKKGGGVALDELADEIEGAYLLEQGGGGDALMERLKQGKKPERTLFQPLNEGVDLDAPVTVVDVTPRFAGRKLWELMKGPERNALRQELVGSYDNRNTGWRIGLTRNGVEHAVSSAKKSKDGLVHMEAVAGLPGLIENAVLVETHADRKGHGLAAVHRMYAPMRLGEDVYAVKLTVKESDAGMVAEIEDVRKLYDLALEKKMPGDLRPPPDAKTSLTGSADSTPGTSELTLRQLLEDVKDSEGQAFFQPAYHGTPHRFERFSLDAIGTGEGAQAHGWGLYFAADRKIANNYRVALAGDGYTYKGKPLADLYAELEDKAEWDKFTVLEDFMVKQDMEEMSWEDYEPDAAKWFREKIAPHIKGDGPLYKVEVPENDVLLDEQKRFYDQPENVLKALAKFESWPHAYRAKELAEIYGQARKLGGEEAVRQARNIINILWLASDTENAVTDKMWDDLVHVLGGDERFAERVFSRGLEEHDIQNMAGRVLLGDEIYSSLTDLYGSPRAASEALNAAGIKGITYKSKRDGRCFVVFDDKAIKLLETYYQGQNRNNARASIIPVDDKYLIQLFKKADLSSLLHETGHFFLLELENDMRLGVADDALKADYATLRAWLGAEDSAELTREQHEKFARGFEAYLREGKAPSKTLESAFSRFKKWLTSIYKKARALNVELTDEVRGVFDRLLATQTEVDAAAQANGLLDITARELDALGIKGAERVYASGLMKAARAAAAVRLQEARDRNRKEQLATWAKEAREEVDNDPVYVARRDMRAHGLDIDAVRENFGDAFTKKLQRAVPTGLKHGGEDPDIFAAKHGFRSVAEMLTAVRDAEPIPRRMREIVVEKQRVHDALYDPAEFLLETDAAAEQVALVGRYLAERSGVQSIQQDAVSRVARDKLAAMQMGKARQSGVFMAAMRRALQAERRAVAAGDFAAALDANTKARLNMEFARQARAWDDLQKTTQRAIKRFVGMAKADPAARFAVMEIGVRHGLTTWNKRLADGKPPTNIRDWLHAVEADGYTIFTDEAVLYGPGKNWRELTSTEFQNLADTVRQIMAVERNRRQLATAQGKAELDTVAKDIASSIYTYRAPKPENTVERENPALETLRGINAVHTKIEALCLALDGGKLGPAWNYIYKPINDAEDEQAMRFKAARAALRSDELFGRYTRKELATMGSRKELVPEIGINLTWENRLAVALNMGNADNIERVKSGHRWTDEQIAAILRPLQKRDWDFVQSVWDYLDTFREESFALQEQVTGLRPHRVEPQPVVTSFGTYRGGYYPIRYNSAKSFWAYRREEKAMSTELFGGNSYSAAMTKTGHLKERAAGGAKQPLLLELSVVTDHVFNVVHDLSYRKAVLDVAKVIGHAEVRTAIESTVGREQYRELLPWLQSVANERQEPMHFLHRMAEWARSSTTMMQMGLKITTALAQPLGYTQSIEVLGYRYAAEGLRKVYARPLEIPELLRATYALSPMMETRMKSYDREMRDITKKLNHGMGRFAWVDFLRDKAFVPMGWMQMSVDLPTWWGGYIKGLKDYAGDTKKAVEYADSVVRLSQGGGATKDLARVQRGGSLARLFTMFYSYFNTLYNLAARRFSELKRHHRPGDIFQAANTALLLWFMPAVLGELVVGRGPDEDEEWGEWAGLQILQYPFQAVVGVRDLANHVFGEYGYQITPAQAAPKAVGQWFKSVNKALEEEDAGGLIKPTAEAVGYVARLPLKQAIISVGNVWDYLTGEDPDFEVRDLFFTKPKSRR